MKPVFPADLKGKALFDYIVKNEDFIIHAKKSAIKYADGSAVSTFFVEEDGNIVSKAVGDLPQISTDANKLKVDLVINTTNLFDSHYDVHIPGLWDKSLKDNKKAGYYLLERHSTMFKDVIGEGLSGKAINMGWKDLGFEFTGTTQALMFSGVIEKDRNPYMFEQYAKRRVKQHSVGMRYVKLVTCIDDEDYPVQKENWDKYFPMVANSKEAKDAGFFWAILEAKVNEGSAVLFGSNEYTPTHMVAEYTGKKDDDTVIEPLKNTHDQPEDITNLLDLISKTTFLN